MWRRRRHTDKVAKCNLDKRHPKVQAYQISKLFEFFPGKSTWALGYVVFIG